MCTCVQATFKHLLHQLLQVPAYFLSLALVLTPYSIFFDCLPSDSGGPLVMADTDAEPQPADYVLYGVVSWGIGCGKKPGVYHYVPSTVHWITNTAEVIGVLYRFTAQSNNTAQPNQTIEHCMAEFSSMAQWLAHKYSIPLRTYHKYLISALVWGA
jgi:hypothetical protein